MTTGELGQGFFREAGMISRRQLLLVSVTMVLAAAGLAVGARRRAFHRRIDRDIADLLAGAQTPPIQIVSESDLEPLPPPVQRWLQASGVVGAVIPSVVRLRQQGEFRLGADKPWMPMEATEYFTTNPPGFLWNTSMEIFPMTEVSGRDRYFQGRGDIEMRVASLYPVARKSGGNLNAGALLRYLNEAMWFPAVLVLPNVAWETVDDSTALATLTDAGQSVSAIFEFDAEDRLANMTADRWNDAEQAFRPWSTPLTDWGTCEGISMPIAGSGAWGAGSDAYEYIRLHLTEVVYDSRSPRTTVDASTPPPYPRVSLPSYAQPRRGLAR